MKHNPGKYHRHSLRLKYYDYSQPGAYFITICVKNRECLFGEIINGKMQLNEYGEIVRNEWFKSRTIREEIELYDDEFVVMPNHIHGIVWIKQSSVAMDIENICSYGNIRKGERQPLQNYSFVRNHI